MAINYQKASLFLIIFLIFNILSPIFIDYEYFNDERGEAGLYIYSVLWITWLLASLLIVILYLLDSRKNKKVEDLSSETPVATQSKTADFLTSFLLSMASGFLLALLISRTTDAFGFLGGDLAIIFFIIFTTLFIFTPAYFFILRKNISITKKMTKILIIFTVTYLIIFIPQVARHIMIQREKQQFYKENPGLKKVLDMFEESKKKNQ